MRLEYNVIWIEDHVENVKAQHVRIESQLRTVGFRLRTEFATSVEAGVTFLSDSVFSDHVDLVVIDYDLGSGTSGDEGLINIREMMPYKDIVFYSGGATSNLRQIVRDRDVDGVFVAHRGDLPEVVLGIISNSIRKTLDIDHARGVALGAFSEIEFKINECLRDKWNSCQDGQKRSLMEQIQKLSERKKIRSDEIYAVLASASDISAIYDHTGIITSSDRVVLLRKLIESIAEDSATAKWLIDYEQNVLPKRNDLAHYSVERDGFKRTFVDRYNNVVDSGQMRELRLKLLDVDELLNQLSLDGQDD